MAPKSFLILCVLAVGSVVSAHGASSSSNQAPAPSADCSNLILDMADCLSFVTNGSTTTKPEGNCCSGLKTVLKADPSCLCQAFKSSAKLGVVLNVTKALALPAACKVSAPSLSNCGLSVAPAGAPGISPASSPTSAPTALAPSPGKSASSLLSVSAATLLLVLSVATLSLLS